jgi:activator of HSP90 ATPase
LGFVTGFNNSAQFFFAVSANSSKSQIVAVYSSTALCLVLTINAPVEEATTFYICRQKILFIVVWYNNVES